MAKKRRLVVANWKMHPATLADAKKLFAGVKKEVAGLRGTDVVICPPSVYLANLRKSYKGKNIHFGAQDVFWGTVGSHTGEVSASLYADVGATYAIVGHSERRARGESEEDINKKVLAVLGAKIRPILCIGEITRDNGGAYLDVLKTQLERALAGVSRADLSRLVIAYEPVWAMGKSADDAMQPDAVHETVLYIRKVLSELYERTAAMTVGILYGGSVEPENAGTLLERGEVDGFLVGHASLEPEAFGGVLDAAHYTA